MSGITAVSSTVLSAYSQLCDNDRNAVSLLDSGCFLSDTTLSGNSRAGALMLGTRDAVALLHCDVVGSAAVYALGAEAEPISENATGSSVESASPAVTADIRAYQCTAASEELRREFLCGWRPSGGDGGGGNDVFDGENGEGDVITSITEQEDER